MHCLHIKLCFYNIVLNERGKTTRVLKWFPPVIKQNAVPPGRAVWLGHGLPIAMGMSCSYEHVEKLGKTRVPQLCLGSFQTHMQAAADICSNEAG